MKKLFLFLFISLSVCTVYSQTITCVNSDSATSGKTYYNSKATDTSAYINMNGFDSCQIILVSQDSAYIYLKTKMMDDKYHGQMLSTATSTTSGAIDSLVYNTSTGGGVKIVYWNKLQPLSPGACLGFKVLVMCHSTGNAALVDGLKPKYWLYVKRYKHL